MVSLPPPTGVLPYRNSLHAAGSGQRKRGQSFQI
nr:MAG TPA: hypothetical protein [Caudoviricetes sp.]